MKRLAIVVACLLPVGVMAAEPKMAFEAASVKPSAPSIGSDFHGSQGKTGPRFGPGTADATRWACDNCSLGLLIAEAYDLKRFQITGPKWVDSEKFDVVARVAEGASKNDLRLMEQNLLAERFGLKARVGKKEMQVYDLAVGKGTPKLKPAAPAKAGVADAPPTHEFGHGAPAAGGDGFRSFNAGRTNTVTMHGATRHQAVGEDMQQLADLLSTQLDKPVTNSTGLSDKYDFLLTFSAIKPGDFGGGGAMMHGGAGGPGGGHGDAADADPMSQPPLMKAIQDQLGLRLESKKGMANMLIVDHLEKGPTEN